ncbi:TPA: hypothetical protein RQK74_004383 [Vibrio vulnificus]|uniref:hypothetical protein n=1 Tax=Vibrio vulnificus TaxID=672 RepID=UPI001A28151F|nr:hypothetical protein [Vibrio vulnificus]HAT8500453.1 hypothetical protein [Vibrio vulnificus]HDY7603527.1 hypothetical protein [Vibrio vulnificus]HDY7883373.1 hypothetical protein [Vibrio vulnificus]HDY8002427.1 hypothetical protein [Vibrio vulnificus]
MSIMPNLRNPNDLLLKLCRESINVYSSQKDEDVLDHFFNFCVTAHSLRDWVIKSGDLSKDTLHSYCNAFESLKMCRDIANANKHFGLDQEKVSSVSKIDVNELAFYSVVPTRTIKKSSLEVLDKNGDKFCLKDFMNSTIEAWIDVFDHFAIPREQRFTYARSLDVTVGDYVLSYI